MLLCNIVQLTRYVQTMSRLFFFVFRDVSLFNERELSLFNFFFYTCCFNLRANPLFIVFILFFICVSFLFSLSCSMESICCYGVAVLLLLLLLLLLVVVVVVLLLLLSLLSSTSSSSSSLPLLSLSSPLHPSMLSSSSPSFCSINNQDSDKDDEQPSLIPSVVEVMQER